MYRMIRAAAAAAILTSGLGSIGCVHTGGAKESTPGDHYRNLVDPCYPERYQYAARQAVIGPFAQQVYNGHVMNQTIWNYYFEMDPVTKEPTRLTLAGREKLDSLARVRPGPDARIYIQTARDLPATIDSARIADVRAELDTKRAAAIQKYLASEPAYAGAVPYEIYVHDPAVPGINSEFAGNAYRGSLQGYRGGVSGAGTGVLGTGGSTNLTAPTATAPASR